MKPLNLADDAPWKQRYRASIVFYTQVAFTNPTRGLACSNQSEVLQLYAWDVPTGDLRQLTFEETGKVNGGISPDGKYIYYLQDEGNNEIGHYVRVPFEGGDPEDMTPNLPPYSTLSISQSLNSRKIGFTAATEQGFYIYVMDVVEDGSLGEPYAIYASERLSFGAMLSYDGDYAVVATTERSEYMDFTLLAFNLNSEGGKLHKALQAKEGSIQPVAFAPLPGDTRMLATSNVTGFNRPVIWDVKTGDRMDIPLQGMEGDISPWDWSPDGSKILLYRLHQAEFELYIYDIERSTLEKLDHPDGSFGAAYFMPGTDSDEYEIYANWQDSTQPSRVIALDANTGQLKRTVLAPSETPIGTQWQSITFPSTHDIQIQGWLALPEGDGPFPMILNTHGGPTAVTTNVFSPTAQAWVDHGFAWLSINYRGSTTFGRDFEHALYGMPGHREVDDMVAAYQWAVDEGYALADSVLLTGGSYGGYLTLQAIGRKPEYWAGGVAQIAIADWVLMYEDQAETLRGYQRSLFGGTPQERPQVHKASSPITYAEDIKAPLLVIQGRNDTRCPSRQMEVYEQKLKSLEKDIQLHWFEAGHGSYATKQQIEHMELSLRFAYRVLG